MYQQTDSDKLRGAIRNPSVSEQQLQGVAVGQSERYPSDRHFPSGNTQGHML